MPFSKPIRILIIDDDEDDYFITSDYLKSIEGRTFIIEWCYNYKEAIDHISKRQHQVYLADYRLGARTGIDLIREARALQCDEPIILLTGKGDLRIDVEAMQHGAFDYLVKSDLSSEKLERSIRYAIDRANSLKALKANEKKFRNIFNNSKDAVFVCDEDFRFTEVNAAFCKLMDCSEHALLKKKLVDLVPDELHKRILVNNLVHKESLTDFEIALSNGGDEDRPCILSASKEKTQEGYVYYQGILHDITFLRKAERMTLQAEKLAAAGRLVRTLAHEVRNPINNINLAVEHMINVNSNDDDQLYLGIIHRNSDRINVLINELLNSARPAEIDMEACTVQSLMEDVVKASIDRIHLKKIDYQLNIPSQTINIECDKSKLVMALLNIVINAIEAMEEDKGRLTIDIHENGEQLLIYISDNGTGISKENIPRLFEPYFTSKRNGIGLGLASTLNIIQSHQGSVEASSVVNTGTTFIINLPLKHKKAPIEIGAV